MTLFQRFKAFLWYFGHFKVPLIGHLRPKLIVLNDQQLVVKIRLTRRSKNHLNSMYFGALSIGADLAGGLHAFYHADIAKVKISMAFKSFEAQFLRRPESDVYFVCNSGDVVKAMLMQTKESGERINEIIPVKAYINYPEKPEEVADFKLGLSVKLIR